MTSSQCYEKVCGDITAGLSSSFHTVYECCRTLVRAHSNFVEQLVLFSFAADKRKYNISHKKTYTITGRTCKLQTERLLPRFEPGTLQL